MATRANIAIKNEGGAYDCIYTHWSGADHLEILNTSYNGPKKARSLIEVGAISVLDHSLDPNPNLYHGFNGYNLDLPANTHDSAGRQLGVTLAYHRDGGEDLEIDRNITFKECKQNEYLYVWSGKCWRKYKC